ncbi:MAG: hypothetical protein AB7S38_33730 [Vulcanimicrobiota bacterium]
MMRIVKRESSSLLKHIQFVERDQLIRNVLPGKTSESATGTVAIGWDLNVTNDDVLAGNHDTFAVQIGSQAEENARALERHVMEVMKETCTATGQVVEGGRPLDNEMVLDMLDGLRIDFHENGTIKTELHLIGPGIDEPLPPLTPEQQERLEAIIERKWEEWRARKRR